MTKDRTGPVPVDRVLRALADSSRQAIVERLTEGPLSVSSLAAPLDITLTAVAQHLQVLEESGLVRTEKIGALSRAQAPVVGSPIS